MFLAKKSLNFSQGFKSAILPEVKNCQNGPFEPLNEFCPILCAAPHPLKQKISSHLWATPTKTTTDDNHVRWSSAPVQIPGEKHRLTLLHHNEISNSCANYEWWVLVVTQDTTWLGTCPFYFTAMQYQYILSNSRIQDMLKNVSCQKIYKQSSICSQIWLSDSLTV